MELHTEVDCVLEDFYHTTSQTDRLCIYDYSITISMPAWARKAC